MKRYFKKNVSILLVCLLLDLMSNWGSYVFADTQSSNVTTINFTKDVDSVKDNLHGITFGNNTFVAIGRDGVVKTSSDGVSWTTGSSSTHALLLNIVFGSNQFIAVGYDGTIVTSSDGMTWTEKSSGSINQLNAIAWNGNRYVVVGAAGSILSSVNGDTWTSEASGTPNELLDVIYNGNSFVAVGASGTILTSSDGRTWIQRTTDKTDDIRSIAWNGSIFVALGGESSCGDNGPKLISQDGITWTSTAWTKEYVFLNKVISNGNMFIAAGCSLDSSGSIYSSTDGCNWSEFSTSLSFVNAVYGMTYAKNMFVAVGYRGIILTSSEGSAWTIRVTPDTGDSYRALVNSEDKLVAVGTSGEIITSQDGVTWTQQNSNMGTHFKDIAWNGSNFVAVGDSGIICSQDGVTWTTSGSGHYTTVTWDGSRFIALGFYGDVISSNDGLTWASITSLPSQFSMTDIVYDGSKYVAVGKYSSNSNGLILTSVDGTVWTHVVSPSGFLESVTWNGSQFVAVGGISISYASGEFQTIMTSSDGTNWASITSSSNHALKSVIWNGSQFIAVGYGGAILTSISGTDWTEIDSPTVHDLNDIVLYKNQYIVVGDSGLMLRGVSSVVVPAQQLTGFNWSQGSTVGTTRATQVPGGTLKYVVGSANMQAHPNVGDAATSYANTLTVNSDISVIAGQHIFVVRIDNNGAITDWADIAVDTSNINSTAAVIPIPPAVNPTFPVVGGIGLVSGENLSTASKPDNGVVRITPAVTDNVSKAEICLADYKALLDSATETNGIKNITINVDNTNSSTYNIQFPSIALTNFTETATITINTAIARLEVPSNMFDGNATRDAINIGINIARVDKSELSAFFSETIGNSPVLDISATIDGEVKAWNNPDACITISIPYTLKEGENSENITVYYIDSIGNLENMQGVYDSATMTVAFTTTHFSKYFVKKNKISFTDLVGYEYYTKYIENMASKGIIEGDGYNRYSPGKILSRAEFATLLVRMLKLKTINIENPFKDVSSSAWYASYVNSAYTAGLIEGIGENMFAPDDTITNQDAALILVRALKYKGSIITTGSISNVADNKSIDNYAMDAVGFTVSNGIIPLDANGNYNAKSTVNRASAAEYIYNVFHYKN